VKEGRKVPAQMVEQRWDKMVEAGRDAKSEEEICLIRRTVDQVQQEPNEQSPCTDEDSRRVDGTHSWKILPGERLLDRTS
jgi:hypothetical protein